MCESQTRGHYFVAGIVSGGIGCGQADVPGFYVNVAKVRGWIDDKLHVLQLTGSTL